MLGVTKEGWVRKMRFVLIFSCLLCASCITLSKKDKAVLTAAEITYNLPDTIAEIKVKLLLKDCNGGSLVAKPTISIIPAVVPSPHQEHYFKISGPLLSSFSKKRDLKIELYDHGAIKSINASASDRTGAIVGNIIKSVAGFALAPIPKGQASCGEPTLAALRSVKMIQRQIMDLRETIVTGRANDFEKIAKRIDVSAMELARIQKDKLTLDLSMKTSFAKGRNLYWIQWKESDFSKWLTTPNKVVTETFMIGLCVYQQNDNRINACTPHLFQKNKELVPSDTTHEEVDCHEDNCRKTLVFREPVPATIKLISLTDSFSGKSKGETLGMAKLQISQWGEISYFPLAVGFGGSKSLALTLDEFGKRANFGWSSNARGEQITGDVQSALKATTDAIESVKGEELKQKQAEIASLETQQKLNKLENCRTIIENGGYQCPE